MDGIHDSINMSLSKLQEIVEDKGVAVHGVPRVGHNLATKLLLDSYTYTLKDVPK